jgi:hypothetical protein
VDLIGLVVAAARCSPSNRGDVVAELLVLGAKFADVVEEGFDSATS